MLENIFVFTQGFPRHENWLMLTKSSEVSMQSGFILKGYSVKEE